LVLDIYKYFILNLDFQFVKILSEKLNTIIDML
jgi:hypothetical protein